MRACERVCMHVRVCTLRQPCHGRSRASRAPWVAAGSAWLALPWSSSLGSLRVPRARWLLVGVPARPRLQNPPALGQAPTRGFDPPVASIPSLPSRQAAWFRGGDAGEVQGLWASGVSCTPIPPLFWVGGGSGPAPPHAADEAFLSGLVTPLSLTVGEGDG